MEACSAKNSLTIGNYLINSEGNSDALIVKYNANGEVEWVDQAIRGSSNDLLDYVIKTTNNRYIFGGTFNSTSIKVGNYELENNNQSTSSKTSDIILIEYGQRELDNNPTITKSK